ncbi:hypothetical protein [Pseudomonas fluorescens]|uniref:hypothetical protein n=1 Tax=Pseudomonas fluorescens TaxID=294 RepID=UPI001249B004|nr:hypothetical protein [Pseudomonas fluorescens]CAG8866501.1 hypothetical protein PS861_01518 [Pseudomonas fluorescens]
MGSLQEELAKVFPELGNQLVKEKSVTKTGDQPVPPSQIKYSSEQDWKDDVRPLKYSKDSRPPDVGSEVTHKKKPRPVAKPPSGQKQNKQRAPDTQASEINCGDMKFVHEVYHPASKTSPRPPAKVDTITIAELDFDAVSQAVLTRVSEFKMPEDWVKEGSALQANGGGTSRALSVRVGIDFGTAYTKLAIRAADKVFLVDWDGVRSSPHRYFLPGELSCCTDGGVWLGRTPEKSEVLSNLKLPFISSHPVQSRQLAAAVVFLAWVMRYARAWLYRHQAPLVGNRRLVWEVNLGIPTNSWLSPLKDDYNRIGCWGWQLSQTHDKLTLEAADALMQATPVGLADIGLDGLYPMPEFVAQIAGYVKSPQRRNGLHLLLDVGAGTMDVAVFNVYRESQESEDRFPIFASTVKPLGTHFLMARRSDELGLSSHHWDDIEGTPTTDKLAERLAIDRALLQSIDKYFALRVSDVIGEILHYTKAHRYPNAPEWTAGIPVFLAGGGSTCDVYLRALKQAFEKIKAQPLRTQFPMLETTAVSSIGPDDFHRLSVAHGLTYDAVSIGNIIAPHEIEDIERHVTVRERPDRDELYPK